MENMSPPAAPDEVFESTEFAFVTDQSPHDVRSHAMREHWKQRRRRKSLQHRASQQWSQPILAKSDSVAQVSAPTPAVSPTKTTDSKACNGYIQNDVINHSHERRVSNILDGIPAQVLSGMNLALGSSRLDPFDKFPIKLTAQHHKLLHHWLSIYATMMFDFDHLPLAKFNPMRDVWFPLDLSNAASFNAVMAQSAAHLSRMQGHPKSAEALKFKAEAIRIISLWMADETLALGDDVVAAVSRILTYERYWGTEAEWQVHRGGLQRMVDARGGIASLQGNWRLELTVYLITLMTKPSWFDSSNQLWEICDSSISARLHPVLGHEDSLHRVRSLWLISFIQDLRTLMNNSLETYCYGIAKYTAIQAALAVIRAELPEPDSSASELEGCHEREYARLACLLFITMTIQTSINCSGSQNGSECGAHDLSSSAMNTLETFLYEHGPAWANSTENLYNLLFYGSSWNADEVSSTSYVLNLATIISYMSLETRRGVERCLLHILKQVPANERNQSEDNWTPDALLSSIHGN